MSYNHILKYFSDILSRRIREQLLISCIQTIRGIAMNTNTSYEVKWVNSAYLRDCCGGAMVCGNNFSNKLSFISSMKDCSEILEAMSASSAPKIIFMDNSLKSKLTEQEVKAVLYHEVGHIVCGHLTNKGYDIKQEIEADAYSAKLLGDKKVVANALRKIGGRFDADINTRIAALGGSDLCLTTGEKVVGGLIVVGLVAAIIKKAND